MRWCLLLGFIVFFMACSVKNNNQVELVIDSKSELGEGAIWNYKTGELMWVNIKGKILNFYNPATGQNKEMFTGQMIGTVVPTESGNVLVALKNGIYSFNNETGSKKQLVNPEQELEDNRFNDGKCDPSGRFWAGTLNMKGEKEQAALYRFDPDTTIHKMLDGISISNGIVWTADKTRMYYIDTPTRKIVGYDFNNETGEISNPKTAVEVPDGMGWPDGMTIDENDNVWVALWGGSAVVCWNPQTGDLLETINVPAKNVTSCAFGDDNLGTLYITTAREDTSDEELEKFTHAGGVFKVRPGVKGVKANFFNNIN